MSDRPSDSRPPGVPTSPLTESPNTFTVAPEEIATITDPDLRLLVADALATVPVILSSSPGAPTVTAYMQDAAGRQRHTVELGSGTDPEAMATALDAAGEDEVILARLLEADGRYHGLILTFTVDGSPWNQMVKANDHPDAVMPLADGTPMLIGVVPSGRLAAVAASDGRRPRIVVTRTVIESALFAGPVVRALFGLNAVLGFLDAALVPEDVDAPLSALPSRLPPSGLGLEEDYALVAIRWRADRAPQGRVYPALPQGHPAGGCECVCGDALGNGDHVSTLALGPAPHDEDARFRYHANRWHDAVAILLHRRCLPRGLHALFDTFQAIGTGLLSRRALGLDVVPEGYRDPFLTLDHVLSQPDDDLRALVLAAFRVESGGAAMGWDAPTILNVLVRTPPGPGCDTPPVTALGVLLTGGAGPTPLRSFLTTTLKDGDGKVRPSLLHPTGAYWAVALAHEAWSYRGTPEEYEKQWKGTRAADIPGSVEIRAVTLVSDHFTVLVTRVRGQEPTGQVFARGRESALPDGDLPGVEADLRHLHRELRTAYAARPTPPASPPPASTSR